MYAGRKRILEYNRDEENPYYKIKPLKTEIKIDPRELKNKIIQGIGYRANKIMEKKHILELQKRFEELEKNLNIPPERPNPQKI